MPVVAMVVMSVHDISPTVQVAAVAVVLSL
jgi:hypothetical protein